MEYDASESEVEAHNCAAVAASTPFRNRSNTQCSSSQFFSSHTERVTTDELIQIFMYELKCEQIGLYSVLQMGREDLEALLWRHFQYDPWQQAELLLFIDRLKDALSSDQDEDHFSAVEREAFQCARQEALEQKVNNLTEHARVVERRLEDLLVEHGRLLTEHSEEGAPEDFICPISGDVMCDPVVTSDGHTYDREAISEWLARKQTSPLTNDVLTDLRLIPNHALRRQILMWKERNQAEPVSPVTATTETANVASHKDDPEGSDSSSSSRWRRTAPVYSDDSSDSDSSHSDTSYLTQTSPEPYAEGAFARPVRSFSQASDVSEVTAPSRTESLYSYHSAQSEFAPRSRLSSLART